MCGNYLSGNFKSMSPEGKYSQITPLQPPPPSTGDLWTAIPVLHHQYIGVQLLLHCSTGCRFTTLDYGLSIQGFYKNANLENLLLFKQLQRFLDRRKDFLSCTEGNLVPDGGRNAPSSVYHRGWGEEVNVTLCSWRPPCPTGPYQAGTTKMKENRKIRRKSCFFLSYSFLVDLRLCCTSVGISWQVNLVA